MVPGLQSLLGLERMWRDNRTGRFTVDPYSLLRRSTFAMVVEFYDADI
jgi:hypothetical protein